MEDIQHVIVADHIGDLLREGDALRAERQLRHTHRPRDGNHHTRRADHGRSARVRLGRWLIGVGAAVAGGSADPQDGPAGRAA